MSDVTALEPEAAEAKLAELDVEWALVGGFELERVFEFSDFVSALAFVNQVGELAEQQNHHPAIELEWGKVVIHLTTHEASGLTQADFELAERIDNIEVRDDKKED